MKVLLFSVRIEDCRVDTFRCSGNGGQNVNKVESGVRITHPPSGAVSQSCDTRDQLRNKRIAWRRLCATKEFKVWHKLEASRRLGLPSIDATVDRLMNPRNLRVEVFNGQQWQKEDHETNHSAV